jgi:hypothetical protein
MHVNDAKLSYGVGTKMSAPIFFRGAKMFIALIKTLRRKKDRSTRTQLKTGVNSVVPKGLTVPSPRVAPVVIAVVYTIHAQNITLIKA